MKRGGWLKRRKPLRRVSEKRLAALGERIEMLDLASHFERVCVGERLIPLVRCDGPLDPHEPLTRARGGSIVDRRNVVWICRRHHGYVHRHPEEGRRVGAAGAQLEAAVRQYPKGRNGQRLVDRIPQSDSLDIQAAIGLAISEDAIRHDRGEFLISLVRDRTEKRP